MEIVTQTAPPDKKGFLHMNFDEVKAVLFHVLEGMGYTLDLDASFDLQPVVVTFERKSKRMCIDPKADSLHQLIGTLSMYFEEFPAPCERAVYSLGERPSNEDEKLFRDKIGYVRLDNYDLRKFIRFLHAIMLAAQQKVR